LSDAAASAAAGHSISQTGKFELNKRTLQMHSLASHNQLRSTPEYQDEVLFRISPESNSNIYDLTAVGLRPGAQETADDQDIAKMYQQNSSVFLLYSLSTDNQKLAVNTVSPGTSSVKLCLHPGDNGGRMTLSASRTESIENVWLEDLFTNTVIDLKKQDSYSFTASPQDAAERFIVHFSVCPLSVDDISDSSFLQCYYNQGALVIKGLKEKDLGSHISLIDMQGRTLKKETVIQTPEMRIPVQIGEGIYIAQLQGNRCITVKFRK
jgi:hypothetical protein